MNTDYKYIGELLERYWQCDTSPEEESQLRAFFLSNDIPGHLLPYRDLFVYQYIQQNVTLGDDFDERMINRIETPVVKAKRMTLGHRLTPLFKAVAMVAVVLVIGNVLQRALFIEKPLEPVYGTEVHTDPGVALENVSSELIAPEATDKLPDQHLTDSVSVGKTDEMDN